MGGEEKWAALRTRDSPRTLAFILCWPRTLRPSSLSGFTPSDVRPQALPGPTLLPCWPPCPLPGRSLEATPDLLTHLGLVTPGALP